MKNNMKTSVMFMAAVMALVMTGCGSLDGSVSSSEKNDSQITETTTVSTTAQWTPDLPSADTSVTKRTVETTTTTTAKTKTQTSKTTKKTEKKSETSKKTTTSKPATKAVTETQPVQQETQTYTYYETPVETYPETEYTQPVTQATTQVTTRATTKATTKATTTTTEKVTNPKSDSGYSDWDKALAAWAIGDISASQRKMITDKLNKYTAKYAKSYPFKMKQNDDVVPFRKNGTGKVLEKLTWDEQWNNFTEGISFSDGSSFADIAPYYYQDYMTYDEVLSEAKWSYDDMMNYKLKDSFEDGRLDATCAGNYDVTIEYNWAFYEDTDASKSYTSQSGHEVHAWYLVFCNKIP